MTTRRKFFIAAGAGALALSLGGISRGAEKKMRRVGFVVPNPKIAVRRLAALSAGLGAFGYVEKKNLIIETRWPAGRERRLRDIPQELIDAQVEVIVIHGGTAMFQVAKDAKSVFDEWHISPFYQNLRRIKWNFFRWCKKVFIMHCPT